MPRKIIPLTLMTTICLIALAISGCAVSAPDGSAITIEVSDAYATEDAYYRGFYESCVTNATAQIVAGVTRPMTTGAISQFCVKSMMKAIGVDFAKQRHKGGYQWAGLDEIKRIMEQAKLEASF